MSNRFYVGTRKGLFTIERNGRGWEVANAEFLGEPVTMFLQDPRDGVRYASLTLGHFGVKLHRSPGGGAAWEEVGVPVYPPGAEYGTGPFAMEGIPKSRPASLTEIWSLEEGGPDQPNLLWAGTIPGGLFRSTDRGTSWELIETLWNRPERMDWMGGGKEQPGIHSICIDPRDSRHVTIGISCGGVWETTDAGENWACRGKGLRAEFLPPNISNAENLQDPHRLAQCRSEPEKMWIQHHNGVFRSTDGAASWQELSDVPPSTFGFAVCTHPQDGDIAWFVPGVKDQCRIPVDGQLVVSRTRDGGQSFDVLRQGLPQQHCYDIVFRHALDIDASGDRLAMGSSTGGLWITENGGDDWTCISTTLPQIYCVRWERGA
jgi:photosystem II stability/assembly factor-like uncharacterized protein